MISFPPMVIDYGPGLMAMARDSVGERNVCNISPNITPENFRLSRSGIWEVDLGLIQCHKEWETKEKAVERIVALGFTVENIQELAVFMANRPEEVERHLMVLALGDQSKWTDPDGHVLTPGVSIEGSSRHFGLYRFDKPLLPEECVLVSRQARPLPSGLVTPILGEW